MEPLGSSATLVAAGIRRELFFFSSQGLDLFGSLYAADRQTASIGVVICPAWSVEAHLRLNAAHALAADVARGGGAALVFHPPGHGDSHGDRADATLDQMVSVFSDAVETLRSTSSPDTIGLAGFRLGAWFAAHAAAAISPTTLLLLQPVEGPDEFFDEIGRRGAVRASISGDEDAGANTTRPAGLHGPGLTPALDTWQGTRHVVRYQEPASSSVVDANAAVVPGDWRSGDGVDLARVGATLLLEDAAHA